MGIRGSSAMLACAWILRSICPAQVPEDPIVAGRGVGWFSIGNVLFADPLDDQERFARDWIVQMNQEGDFERYARIDSGKLEVLDPSGCTIWFRQKLSGPVCITYKAVVSCERDTGTIISPRDLNNFWMAGGPGKMDEILYDERYNGKFPAYHEMNGYYASMGGGNTRASNRTVRMRIYPRVRDGRACEHPALVSQDDNPEFRIVPGKEYKIQLVACKDLIQFIVNERVVYELACGMPVTVTSDDRQFESSWYTAEKYPAFTEGYFGFRMTHSFHKYYDFKVYRLMPSEPDNTSSKPCMNDE